MYLDVFVNYLLILLSFIRYANCSDTSQDFNESKSTSTSMLEAAPFIENSEMQLSKPCSDSMPKTGNSELKPSLYTEKQANFCPRMIKTSDTKISNNKVFCK